MRTLVDIREHQLHALDALSRRDEKSRAALIREAIDDYLARRKLKPGREAFGLWGDRKIDGLEYQERIRSEW